ncbi:PREDICTED: protein preY, mitochondrial, partial [Fulmarus glacialis]|uniref:protein preY, mitochondrial n=1 Tax=Fulmarus glacialis TaxID=30455 RepID=UPI00051B326A
RARRAAEGQTQVIHSFFCFVLVLPLTCLARYEEATHELINEELGIAYPIIDGIPYMIPEAARTTQKKPPAEGSEQP